VRSLIEAGIRRMLDVATALIGLVLTSPILIAAAVAVRIGSPGSALYGAPRVGRGGREFRMWKFRTMHTGAAAAGPPITAADDPRVTGVGRLLRKTKIDELPQLFNVLIGDMSLVGPRPEDPGIVLRYTPQQMATLQVRPGITGPGSLYYDREQVHTIPEDVPADEYYIEHLLGPKLDLELAYLENRTLGKDLKIIWETILHLIRRR